MPVDQHRDEAATYRADGGYVWKNPVHTRVGDKTTISLGFRVCKMCDEVGDEAAETIAALMNAGEAGLAVRPQTPTGTPDGGGAGPQGVDLGTLHAANIARQAEWCPDQVPDLSFRGNELAGETGEACNVIKKLERERQGWRGSRATLDDLAQELADVVICADLCAVTAGIDLGAAVVAKFNATSEKQGLTTKLALRPPLPAAGGDAGEGWQPIETAPRDGRPILVFGGRHDTPGLVKADGDWWNFTTARALGSLPTHWRPLPAPPPGPNEPKQGEVGR